MNQSVYGLYGKGVIFKISTAGIITKLKDLNGTTDGGNPKGSLIQGSDGAFYGTASTGGANKAGTIFRIAGTTYSILHNFNMAINGGVPLGGLIIAPKITLLANPQNGLTTNEDVAKAIMLTGSGATSLTFTVVTQPKNGTISSGSAAARTYTPRANYYGVDSFAFTTNVGCLSSPPAWVKISVTAVNDAPVLTSIGNKSVVKGTILQFTATATDPDLGSSKIFSLITPPAGAAIGASSGMFTWTPSAAGTYSIKVRVSDNLLYDEETITVTVTMPTTTTTRVAMMTGIEAKSNSMSKSTLYPNPVNSSFTLNLEGATGEIMVTIFDIKGSVVDTKRLGAAKQQQQRFEADKLKPGEYFLQIKTTESIQVLKFIKM